MFHNTLCTFIVMQCSPSEFYTLVKNLSHVHDDLNAFSEMASTDISSELLLHAMKEVWLGKEDWAESYDSHYKA